MKSGINCNVYIYVVIHEKQWKSEVNDLPQQAIELTQSDGKELIELNAKIEQIKDPREYEVVRYPSHMEVHNNWVQSMISFLDWKYSISKLEFDTEEEAIIVAKYMNFLVWEAVRRWYTNLEDVEEKWYTDRNNVFTLSESGSTISYWPVWFYKLDISEILTLCSIPEDEDLRKNYIDRIIRIINRDVVSLSSIKDLNKSYQIPEEWMPWYRFHDHMGLSNRVGNIEESLMYDLRSFIELWDDKSRKSFETAAEVKDIILMMENQNPDHQIYRSFINTMLIQNGVEWWYDDVRAILLTSWWADSIEELLESWDNDALASFMNWSSAPSWRLWTDIYMEITMTISDRWDQRELLSWIEWFSKFVLAWNSVLGDEYRQRIDSHSELQKNALKLNNERLFSGYALREFLYTQKWLYRNIWTMQIEPIDMYTVEKLYVNDYPAYGEVFGSSFDSHTDVLFLPLPSRNLWMFDQMSIWVASTIQDTYAEIRKSWRFGNVTYEEFLTLVKVNEWSHLIFKDQYGFISGDIMISTAWWTSISVNHANEFLSNASSTIHEIDTYGSVDFLFSDMHTGLNYMLQDDRIVDYLWALFAFIWNQTVVQIWSWSPSTPTSNQTVAPKTWDPWVTPDKIEDGYTFDMSEYTRLLQDWSVSKRMIKIDNHVYNYKIWFDILMYLIQWDQDLMSKWGEIIVMQDISRRQERIADLLACVKTWVGPKQIQYIRDLHISESANIIKSLDWLKR